ncbi:hypothetical protein SAMN04487995_0174 [Dyadobacter koreensis]|uniref:Patatin-like phospholipase n=1 Tax=Dyadobacter koreensis TaxID=408657 RepID=A0A1H6QC26_9BACT|nr:hypothetical protein [Dyadobacter koreensis]SEI37737.1 hypothetical protein SAMN04487995_0174 [Dyadobacter koreensis]
MKIFRQHLLALWQVSRSVGIIYFMLSACAAVLILPDQSQDMIDEFGQQNIFRDYFLFKSISVCVWTITILACSRILLLSPNEVDILSNKIASKFWMLWLPRLLGLSAGLILAFAFNQDGHGWHSLVIVCYSVFTVILFISIERLSQKKATFYQPVRKTYLSNLKAKQTQTPARQKKTSLKTDFLELTSNRLLRYSLYVGVLLMALIFFLFLIPLFTSSVEIGQFFSAIYIVLLGFSFYTGLGTLIAYFSNFRTRPIALLFPLYFYLISPFNDNSQIRQFNTIHARQVEIKTQFARWLSARHVAPGDSIPMIIIATEGGGIRAAVWTSQLQFRINEQIPGFNRYTFAISGVSGGGVGACFYLAYLSDSLKYKNNRSFGKGGLDSVLQNDFVSPVIGGYFFNESLQLISPWAVRQLDRTKRLEDAWAQAYKNQFNQVDGPDTVDTFNNEYLALFRDSVNCEIPSLILNGTLAETGQKTVVSNLKTNGKQSFKDVVDILSVTQRDMPLKTAATMCSRFPFVTSGGLFKSRSKSATGIQSGHVTDGGNFDNTGMETAVQLLTGLLPGIDSLRRDDITVIPYILFFKNSQSEELSYPKLVEAQKTNRGLGIPINSFFNPWNRGSDTRDALYKALTPFTNPNVRYLSFKIDYRTGDFKNRQNLRLPLGWTISRSATKHIHIKADSLIHAKSKDIEFKTLKRLVTARGSVSANLSTDYFLGRLPDLPQDIVQPRRK